VLLSETDFGLGRLDLLSPDIQLQERKCDTRDKNPGEEDAKVQTQSISGSESKGPNGIRDVVEWRRISVLEYPWEDFDRVDAYRYVHDDPENHEERNEFRGKDCDERLEGESDGQHADPIEHPKNHEGDTSISVPNIELKRQVKYGVEKRQAEVSQCGRY